MLKKNWNLKWIDCGHGDWDSDDDGWLAWMDVGH